MTVKRKSTGKAAVQDNLEDVIALWTAKTEDEAVLLDRIHRCTNSRLVMSTLRGVLQSNVCKSPITMVHMILATLGDQLDQAVIAFPVVDQSSLTAVDTKPKIGQSPKPIVKPDLTDVESPGRVILCTLHLLQAHLLKTYAKHCPPHSVHHILALVAKTLYNNAAWAEDDRERLVCAFHLQKLCASLKQYGKMWRDTAMYLIASMIDAQRGTSSSSPVYSMLAIAIYALLDLCDRHAVATLAAQLPKHDRAILKHVNGEFTKYHKFTGMI